MLRCLREKLIIIFSGKKMLVIVKSSFSKTDDWRAFTSIRQFVVPTVLCCPFFFSGFCYLVMPLKFSTENLSSLISFKK